MPAGRRVRVHATGIAMIHPPECVRASSHWYGSITLRALYGHSQPSSPLNAQRGYQYNLADVPTVTTDPLVPRGGPVVAYVSWAASDVFCEGGVQATVLRPLALSRATLVFESVP